MLKRKYLPQGLPGSEVLWPKSSNTSSEEASYPRSRPLLELLSYHLGEMCLERSHDLLGRQVPQNEEQPPVNAFLTPLEDGVLVVNLINTLSVELPLDHVELCLLYLLLL